MAKAPLKPFKPSPPSSGTPRKKAPRWKPPLYTKAIHSGARSAGKSDIFVFVENIRTNSPEFLENLGDKTWTHEALIAPIIARAQGTGLIEVEGNFEAFGGLVDLAQLAPHHLLTMITDALKDRAKIEPDWLYGPQGPHAQPKKSEDKSWGPGTKVNQPAGDIPPQDDPRFGTW